ncbi:putative Serine/threonine-protein kinase dst1 [Nannochloris sp. 'desiccata']|nr:putative Serine/threonine-protein kinase dst1 [Chlorella desiccata (nom. nud.)]
MAADYEKTLPAGAAARIAPQDNDLSLVQPEEQEMLTDPSSVFELLNPLGRGSYGSVYKARIIESNDIVAVKIIPLTEQDEMDSIQKEIAMLRDCNHPNIVRYYGAWRAPDALWIAMEYCAGGSVSDIMHACNAPLEEAVISYICAETLAGLVYLHALGRVHRDIKCGNILLTDSGEVKLADFGVAAQLSSTLSKRNTFIGTPHWMAPEVIQASHYDGKVDIWALGISSIEMAERYPPRWRVNPNRVIFMVVRDPPPRLTEKERWTLAFQDFIAQCLSKDPRSRPTARYLQQHKFIARDRAIALRALMPLVHRAELEYASLLDLGGGGGHHAGLAGTGSEDGYFSWRHHHHQQQQVAGTVLAGGRPLAASGTVVESRPAGGGGGASQMPFSNLNGTGTLIMNKEDSPGRGVGLQHRISPSGQEQQRRPSSTNSSQGQSFLIHGGINQHHQLQQPVSEASIDYLAAVQSAAGGGQHIADLGDHPHHHPNYPGLVGRRGSQYNQQQPPLQRNIVSTVGTNNYTFGRAWSPAGDNTIEGLGHSPLPPLPWDASGVNSASHRANKGEAHRIAERLYTIHSSGEIVPLPFLQATDFAPLALLGLHRHPASEIKEITSQHLGHLQHHNQKLKQLSMAEVVTGKSTRPSQDYLDWQGALRDVLIEAQSGEEDGGNDATGQALFNGKLSPALVARIQASPVLLNLASALASHKAALEEQRELGAPVRVQEPTKQKAEVLADTLRAILCL